MANMQQVLLGSSLDFVPVYLDFYGATVTALTLSSTTDSGIGGVTSTVYLDANAAMSQITGTTYGNPFYNFLEVPVAWGRPYKDSIGSSYEAKMYVTTKTLTGGATATLLGNTTVAAGSSTPWTSLSTQKNLSISAPSLAYGSVEGILSIRHTSGSPVSNLNFTLEVQAGY